MNYSVSTEIQIEVRGQEFVIDIYADVDGDHVPDNIELAWHSNKGIIKDLPKRMKAYVEEHFEDEINSAICSAPLDYSDSLYDTWKESF
ncbi:MAG TPA: hypothetical protein DHV22_12300 [Xanthomarina gelatinilytica]|uniref:Uncharacterized protein n=1 Tax=Xanthomarina gelatinilytica TaxID=1137281 RepID=A0A3D6BTV4_9FLAO|nr:hypothetical protein [Xanthomarina gelatinilytica]